MANTNKQKQKQQWQSKQTVDTTGKKSQPQQKDKNCGGTCG